MKTVPLEREAQAQKPMLGAEWAERLRKARRLLTKKEHKEFAGDIEKARKLISKSRHLRS